MERFAWEDGADEAGEAADDVGAKAEAIQDRVSFQDEADDDDGVYEVDPTKWSQRTESSDASAYFSQPRDERGCKPMAAAEWAPPPPPIEEPPSANPDPMSAARRAIKDAASTGPPPERAATSAAGVSEGSNGGEDRAVVEAQVMTKRMLRELAMRRGVSYTVWEHARPRVHFCLLPLLFIPNSMVPKSSNLVFDDLL